MTFSELSAGILERYRNSRMPDCSFTDLDRLAATIPPSALGLRVHPDAFRSPVSEFLSGRKDCHTAAHEVRAILLAVAQELKGQVSTLSGGEIPAKVLSGGGAACSALWLDIKKDMLGCSVEAVDCSETAYRGAVWLALSTLSRVPVEKLASST